jgi:hypothetical protein
MSFGQKSRVQTRLDLEKRQFAEGSFDELETVLEELSPP